MFLIFDTETTGLPKRDNAPISEVDNWPRVVQLAWQLHDETGELLEHHNLMIRPDGFEIPYSAEKVHGISTAMALQKGLPLRSVLERFNDALIKAQYLIGHNIRFDINALGAEFIRGSFQTGFMDKMQICTMESTTEHLKLPGGRGSWAAFWMMPEESKYGIWPNSGELDIMEYVGYDPTVVHGSVHTNSYNHLLGTQKTDSIIVPTCETSYHVYAMEWYPTNISFFVDDINYFTFYKDVDATWEEWPFDEEFFIIINIAVGGFWGGAYGVNDAIFPQQMVIDYVRVYQ